MDPQLLSQNGFLSDDGTCLWGLDRRLTKALVDRMHITTPSLVQIEVVPLALQGKDILVNSKTGSGKTLAYLLPLCQKLLHHPPPPSVRTKSRRSTVTTPPPSGVRALILVPTRELCDQIESVLSTLLFFCTDTISFASLGKGSLEVRQARLAEHPNIVIATPGRVVEHMAIDASLLRDTVETLVVDEADMILAYGNANDIKTTIDRVPTTCQCLLMSATLDDDIKQLKRVVLKDAVTVKLRDGDAMAATISGAATTSTTTTTLTQWCVMLKADDKDLVVYALLKLSLISPGKALFFVNTIDRGYRLKVFLEQFGIKAAVLNSELPTNSRRHILDAFDKGAFDYLIATDEALMVAEEDAGKKRGVSSTSEFSASRGVDFRGVQTVINVDLPTDATSYVHRIGRTARAGAQGTALSLVDMDHEVDLLESIKKAQSPARDGQAQPVPLSIDLSELEGFRYRVDDMRRAVTRKVVNEARVKDLKNEILNSEKLQAHFRENPVDLRLLKHDAPLRPVKVQTHLRHVPTYLVPEHQRVAATTTTTGGVGVMNEMTGGDGDVGGDNNTPLPRNLSKKERDAQYMKSKRLKKAAMSKAKRRRMGDPLG